MELTSRQLRQNQIRQEEILKSLANTPDWPSIGERSEFQRHIDAVERIRKRYPECFRHCSTFDILALRQLLRKAWDAPDDRSREWFVFALRKFHAEIVRRVQTLQGDGENNLVRQWQRRKELLDFALEKPEKAAGALYVMMDEAEARAAAMDAGPPGGEFEEAASYLQSHLRHAKHCLNAGNTDPQAQCPTPYFFIERKGQKYCCDKPCANVGRKLSNRDSARRRREKTGGR